MRYYYDTEFHEDGTTIDLISIGIVAEDGREYYAVNRDADWGRIKRNDWLMRNVVPQLPPDGEWKPKVAIASEVADFLAHGVSIVAQQFGSTLPVRYGNAPELWAWFGAYDHVALAQLFGPMMSLPPHLPMFTRDVKQEHDRLGNIALPAQVHGLHDALADARHVRVMHEYLIEYATLKGRQ